MKYHPNDLEMFLARLFHAAGAPQADAETTAKVLINADRRGVDSHGLIKVASYIQKIRDGSINPRPTIRIEREHETTVVIDGDNGLGPVVGVYAMECCIQKAQQMGVGIVSAHHSNHYGIAAYYAMMALQHNMIGISLTNAPARVVPTNGTVATLGTNPIAAAIPSEQGSPFVLDMATSVRSLGAIQLAKQNQSTIPQGWAVMPDGQAIQDPEQALQTGLLLPVGGEAITSGYKGFALGMLVDLLCSALSGSAFGRGIKTDQDYVKGEPANIGHFFMALRVEHFRPLANFFQDSGLLLAQTVAVSARRPEEPVRIPGSRAYEHTHYTEQYGINIDPEVWKALVALATAYQVQLPATYPL